MPITTLPTQIEIQSMQPLAVSKAEAARLLGMSPHTIDQLIIRGRLRAKRVTRHGTYHVSVQSIHEFLGDK